MTPGRLHDDEVSIDELLVRRLLAEQFPSWSELPLRRIRSTGTSHAVFRLGDELVVRMPLVAASTQQVGREWDWLPTLAPELAVEVPDPLGRGGPGAGYPFEWLVSRWVDGADGLAAAPTSVDGELRLAQDLAGFVRSLWSASLDGPVPGKRGRDLAPHDTAVRAGLDALAQLDAGEWDELDVSRARRVWGDALSAGPWVGPPVWVHGDLLASNLVLREGRLVGVIDWSATGVGDPAGDLMVAWDWSTPARERLRELLDVDDATWARGRGWVVEQTVAFIPYYAATLPTAVASARRRLRAALAER